MGLLHVMSMRTLCQILHKQKKPELEQYFLKSIGFGMGMEFRDTAYVLSPKNSLPLRTGMVFCLSLGLQGLEEKDGKK